VAQFKNAPIDYFPVICVAHSRMIYPRPTTFTVDAFPPLEGGSVQHRIETSFSQERELELSSLIVVQNKSDLIKSYANSSPESAFLGAVLR